jgi:hypothetical protein
MPFWRRPSLAFRGLRATVLALPTGGPKPETQLDSNGSDAHQPMNAAAAIITAAKPAA